MAATTVGFFWHPPVMPADPLRPISGTTWFHSRFIVSMIANAVMPRKKARAMGVQALRSRADAKAARSRSDHQRATGGRENESAGHCGRIE